VATLAASVHHAAHHPVGIRVEPQVDARDRLTTAFRFILGLPHLLLVGGPVALVLTHKWADAPPDSRVDWAGAGALGAVAAVCAVIAWFAILFTGIYPEGLRALVLYFLRWRVRAIAYLSLLRDDYPPFGDGAYPAELLIDPAPAARNKASVAFRPILVVPHLVAIWALGTAWMITSVIAWFAILFTGRYPQPLYEFGVGVLRWNIRVESYLLLLHDDYPPFSLAS
jgi:hypothetical protein